MTHRVVADYTATAAGSNTNIKVYIRARPLDEDSNESPDFITVGTDDDRKLLIKDPDANNKKYGEVSFQFDQVFWTKASQKEVFETVSLPQVECVLNGFNSCCFACKSSQLPKNSFLLKKY